MALVAQAGNLWLPSAILYQEKEDHVKLGDYDLQLISDGNFWLDGGAMFGVVPRPMWEKKTTPDEKNRICLGLNCLLVRTGRHNILIDTGCGEKYSEKEKKIYRIEREFSLLADLDRKTGLSASDITMVINTHLHFDHCGGNTSIVDGRVVPTFPEATYLVRRNEYQNANHPNERTTASYFENNWRPIEKSGRLRLVDEDEEVLPGIHLVRTPGHTEGHQSVLIESNGSTLFCLGDLCPTSAHVSLPWIMAYDLYPLTTLATKKEIFRRALEEQWLLFFVHDPQVVAGQLLEEDGKYHLAQVAWQS
jgi:glyoxylase-like metal-dependent hydrolase (beta-lactamase superfamily II)